MYRKKHLFPLVFLTVLLILLFITGDRKPAPQLSANSPVANPQTRQNTATRGFHLFFHPMDEEGRPLEGVSIVLIGRNGEVLDVLTSNGQGIAEKQLELPLDPRFVFSKDHGLETLPDNLIAIAYKQGYRETVLFHAYSDVFYMYRIRPEYRNEPQEQLGNIHHLQVCALVEKYSRYAPKHNTRDEISLLASGTAPAAALPSGWKLYGYDRGNMEVGYPEGYTVHETYGHSPLAHPELFTVLYMGPAGRVPDKEHPALHITLNDRNYYETVERFIKGVYEDRLEEVGGIAARGRTYKLYRIRKDEYYVVLLEGKRFIYQLGSSSHEFLSKVLETFYSLP